MDESAEDRGAFAHAPQRPSWDCRTCGRPWPCEPARKGLAVEFAYAPASLALYMGAHYIDACADMPTRATGELYPRFLGWLRPISD
jgi:hypothetical protein